MAEFSILLSSNPDYTPGYFMAAQALVRADQGIAEAKTMLTERYSVRPTHREPSCAG
jgi:hypothetical protein